MGNLRLAVCVLGIATGCGGGAAQSPAPGAPPPAPAPPPPPPLVVPVADANPFDGARLYVNPDYASEVRGAVAAAPAEAAHLRKLEHFSTAVWLDSIAKAGKASRYLDEAAAMQASGDKSPVVIVFALYDLPNRDCAAASSAGELSVEHDGEHRYQTEYIDPIAAQFKSHPSLRIAVIVEPDSLANIATNLDKPKCAASQAAYVHSTAYALRTLTMTHVSLYLDAAHAGWLGWAHNRDMITRAYQTVFTQAGGQGRVRGFVTNVSNYNTLEGGEGAKLEPSDPAPDELTYVHKLDETLTREGVHAGGFIIDTSRNGRPTPRSKWGSWCNVRGAGLGERPRASPGPRIDAYYWVKPPGESDGTSDPAAPRFDAACAGPDSTPNAPQAGVFFPAYVTQLTALANPPL
jgi:cellulose 1,4-beta-cellobiosidase